MSRTMSVTLGSQLNNLVSSLLDSGRYDSTSEIMRSALKLLEQQESQLEALKQAVDAGRQSGVSKLSLDEIANQVKQKHNVWAI